MPAASRQLQTHEEYELHGIFCPIWQRMKAPVMDGGDSQVSCVAAIRQALKERSTAAGVPLTPHYSTWSRGHISSSATWRKNLVGRQTAYASFLLEVRQDMGRQLALTASPSLAGTDEPLGVVGSSAAASLSSECLQPVKIGQPGEARCADAEPSASPVAQAVPIQVREEVCCMCERARRTFAQGT